MTQPDSHSAEEHEHFSPGLFVLTVALTAAALCLLLRFAAPALWEQQLQASIPAFAAAFVAVTLANCFLEFFFHRYVLHRPAIPGLSRLYRQHTLHHALTRIARKPSRDGRGLLFVENKFPITEPEQGEGSFFPWYSLAGFVVLMSPLFFLLQWLAPGFPWFLAGLAAMVSSLTLYELLHAINHWPLERWLPLVEHPRHGWFWRPVYSFHLRHHAVIDCNESVSGFFGLPLADWLFRTCVIPPSIYADGEEWRPENFVAPRPRALVRWLDRCAEKAITARRERAGLDETFAGRGYSRGEKLAYWLTHGVGAVLSIVALTVLLVVTDARGQAWQALSFAAFGLSLLVLHSVSVLYHAWRAKPRRGLFRCLDRAAIFLLIAGVYTTFLLANLRGPWGWSLFGVLWGLCGAGAVFEWLAGGRTRLVTVPACLFAGWLLLVALQPVFVAMPPSALWLLLTGGLLYTAGLPFYLWRRLRYHHTLWHGFVLGGGACHFLAVWVLLASGGA